MVDKIITRFSKEGGQRDPWVKRIIFYQDKREWFTFAWMNIEERLCAALRSVPCKKPFIVMYSSDVCIYIGLSMCVRADQVLPICYGKQMISQHYPQRKWLNKHALMKLKKFLFRQVGDRKYQCSIEQQKLKEIPDHNLFVC